MINSNLMPKQAAPVSTSGGFMVEAGVTESGIACTICQTGCSLLSGLKKTLCEAACSATVC
jgi:hypothetical protein